MNGVALVLGTIRASGVRGLVLGVGGAVVALALIGVPTDVLPNPWFARMTPVRPQDVAIWAGSGLLTGLIAATYAAPLVTRTQGKLLSGGLLSVFALGCPICNKLVVLAIGASGALSYFEPLQIYLGIASLMLLAWSLRLRLRALAGFCALPSRPR